MFSAHLKYCSKSVRLKTNWIDKVFHMLGVTAFRMLLLSCGGLELGGKSGKHPSLLFPIQHTHIWLDEL